MFKKLEGYIGSELNRKKLENDLSHLYQAIPDILCLGNFKGQFLKINKAGCELLGYTEQEIINHNFEEFVHPEDKENMINDFKRLIKEGTNSAFESRYITKSGAVVWLSWTCNSSSAEGLIYATAKNITEEKKLRELNRQANSLAKIGSWELNLVNQVLYWSDEVHQLHETDPKLFEPNLEEAINFYREDFRETVQLNIKKSIATGAPFDFEVVLVTAKRKELWVRSIGKTEFVDGECTRIFGSFQDIDIRKKAEIERNRIANDLLKNIKNLEQFTYIVSHNLRAPVANILGLASVLKNKINETDKERAEKYLFTAVAQMDETIKDLNKILQIRGEYSEFKEPIYLPDLLKDIQSSIQDIISKESVIIRPAFGNVSTLTTIKSYMQSVFYNLILNSIKYRKKGVKPIIEIRSELNNERVRLIFKDNGSGIDLEKHGGNIFGLYKRFHMDVEGKGLGLFMIKTQIEVMGGSISVKSIPNEGAEFTVELPLN